MKNSFIFNWITSRFNERTTWDGVVLIAAGLAFFVFKPIASFAAIVAILYGLWAVIQPEF